MWNCPVAGKLRVAGEAHGSELDDAFSHLLAVSQGHACFRCGWITTFHLSGRLLNDSVLALEQTGLYPFVFRTRPHRCVLGRWAGDAEQAFHDLLWVRTQGVRVKTAATVAAMRFLLAF